LKVPSQYVTVQAAVDICEDGDTILVAPEPYDWEAPVLTAKNDVTIMSEGGRDFTFLVRTSVRFYDCNNCRVQGFTFPGVLIYSSSYIVISDCDFGMAGVYPNQHDSEMNSFNIEIINNRIHDGRQIAAIEGQGHLVILGNEIYDSSGIGIQLWGIGPSVSRIENNVIRNNGWSGVVLSGDVIVKQNVITENSGNGIENPLSCEIAGNTIARNALCGIYFPASDPPTPDIHHNIISSNGYAGILANGGCNAFIHCNDVWGNSNLGNGNYIGFIPDQTGFNGNISADPYFCNASGGVYSLAANSPALHASCGPMGAILIPGCSNQTAVEHLSWGSIKALYK
jgi:hypothetical protein